MLISDFQSHCFMSKTIQIILFFLIEESILTRMTGEAKSIRAYSYFKLISNYGGVPLITNSFTLDDNFNIPRNSYDEVMNFVISELDAAIEMLGYDVNKESINLTTIVKEEYLEYTEKVFKELYEKGFYKNYQAILKSKNNEEKLVQVNSSIIYNKQGKPIAAQGILRDITQENIYKELIEQQKKQLDIIVDHSPIGISLSRKDDIGLIKANNSLTKMLGFTHEEFKKIKLQDLTFDDDKQISEIKRAELYNNKIESYSLNKRYIKKGGEIVWAKTSVTGVKDAENKVKYHVTTIEDITKDLKIPVIYNFPAGHIQDNRALIFGRQVSMEVNDKESKLILLSRSCLLDNEILKSDSF